VHPGNLLLGRGGGVRLLDPDMVHAGCNLLDLDYLDWWGVERDPQSWWSVRDEAEACARAYFRTLGVREERIPAVMGAVALLALLRTHASIHAHGGAGADAIRSTLRRVIEAGLDPATGKPPIGSPFPPRALRGDQGDRP